jgi:thioredoxin 1
MEKTFTDANFEAEVLKADVPVLVDFWAAWCGPCKIMGPIVEEVALALEGKPVKVGKMNVDENQVTPGTYGIMSIPTLMIFKGGVPVETMVGVQAKDKLVEKLSAQLS